MNKEHPYYSIDEVTKFGDILFNEKVNNPKNEEELQFRIQEIDKSFIMKAIHAFQKSRDNGLIYLTYHYELCLNNHKLEFLNHTKNLLSHNDIVYYINQASGFKNFILNWIDEKTKENEKNALFLNEKIELKKETHNQMLNINPIKDLIGKNKTKEALQAVDKLLDLQLAGAKFKNFAIGKDDKMQEIRNKKNEIKLLQGQFEEIEKKQNLQLATDDEVSTQKNKIAFGLLNVLDDLYNWYPDEKPDKPADNQYNIQTTDELLQWLYEQYQAEKPKDDELKFTFHQDFKNVVDNQREIRDLFQVLENQDFIQFRNLLGAYSVRLLNKFFQYFKDKPGEAEVKDVFISYSTQDQEAKNELAQIFDNEGISYWLDETSLSLGGNIQENIEEGLCKTRFTVMLVSANSLLSVWVSHESLFRLKQEIFNNQVSFLPVIIDKVVFNDDFPFEMHDKFEAEIKKQKELRQKAEDRKMKTELYNNRIERLEEILPDITNIIAKITEGLSAVFCDEVRKPKDLKKLIETIKKKA